MLRCLKKTLKTIDIKDLSEEQAVRKIEDWVKNNIALVDGVKVETRNITETVKNKYTNKMGMLVLLVNLYQTAEIPVEVVGTCDRNDRQFDANFDGWNFIDELLLYFPNLKKFMEPSEYEYRLGYFSTAYFNNYGVFMSTIKVDNLTSFKYKSKLITAPPYTQNGDSLEVYASLDDEMTTLKATIKKTLIGEAAVSIQPYYRLMEPEKKQKYAQLYTALSDVLTFDSYSVKNDAPEDLLTKPFIIEGKGHGPLVEQAGNKYIVKLGQIIGPQSELYNVKKRHQPVDVQRIHYYYRKIVFEIPEGYTVADITPMDINVALNDGETPSAGFVSKATRVGNTVVVEISEYYKSLQYPIEQFESFRKVINAAADFNKRSLVLEKKS